MRRQDLIIVFISLLFFACQGGGTQETTFVEDIGPKTEERDSSAAFPITAYLLGELKTIEGLPVTPLVVKKDGTKSDSVWLKREDVRSAAKPFLSPEIDSVYLRKYFNGSTFLDQTVNAVTLTYEVKPQFMNQTPLRQIGVYISPETSKVERVYLVKETDDETQQLTWKSGRWFTIRNIKGNDVKEEKVIWNFDE